jgi:hypothetical protein
VSPEPKRTPGRGPVRMNAEREPGSAATVANRNEWRNRHEQTAVRIPAKDVHLPI